jgi:CRP-like cAMP-binding protein/SAM-dependent methyltransferase
VQEALALLSEFTETDIEWIFDVGIEQQVIANTVIIKEGTDPEALYIVLEGLVGIYVASAGNRQLAALGPGELLGEISFLEDRPASATVVAVENSLLLVLSRDKLAARLEDDSSFASRFYKSLALITSRRLRRRVSSLGQLLQDRSAAEHTSTEVWPRIAEAIEEFKELLQKADQEALKNDNVVPPEYVKQLESVFPQFWVLVNSEIGEDSSLNVHVKEELGARIQRELLPYLLLTKVAERFYSKPRGYAGDFLTIQLMYEDKPGGSGRLGSLLDRCFLNEPATVAVKNRRRLLATEIHKLLEKNRPHTTQVTSLASGSAQELFDVFDSIDNTSSLKATLVDIDLQALAFVSDKCRKLRLQRQMKLVNGNLVYLATGRQKLDVKEQDLVYSIGLIDYFNDKFVIKLMNYAYNLLKSGGKLILGNFHPSNPDRAMMDYVLDWRLIYRTEEDMHRLYSLSRFGRPYTNIRFEPAGINLFAECIKK